MHYEKKKVREAKNHAHSLKYCNHILIMLIRLCQDWGISGVCQCTYGVPLAYPWHTLVYLWRTFGISMVYLWRIHGVRLAYPWCTFGVSMAYAWHTLKGEL